jgi:hypothetical protein
MDGRRFDDLAARVARRSSRRQALRWLGGGLAGGALARLGLRRAAAAPPPSLQCRQCINSFFGRCTAACASNGGGPAGCAEACQAEAQRSCELLGECP